MLSPSSGPLTSSTTVWWLFSPGSQSLCSVCSSGTGPAAFRVGPPCSSYRTRRRKCGSAHLHMQNSLSHRAPRGRGTVLLGEGGRPVASAPPSPADRSEEEVGWRSRSRSWSSWPWASCSWREEEEEAEEAAGGGST